MPTNWVDKFVKCPFYRKSNPSRITCEGFDDHNNVNLTFEDRSEKAYYMMKRCESIQGCRYCPIHNMLERMSGDE